MIVSSKYDGNLSQLGKAKCSVCGDTLHHYPFLEWHCDQRILICPTCCQTMKRGFMADLIQLAATRDLQDVGYSDHKLIRKHDVQLEKEYWAQRDIRKGWSGAKVVVET
jgi:hypothetical protein